MSLRSEVVDLTKRAAAVNATWHEIIARRDAALRELWAAEGKSDTNPGGLTHHRLSEALGSVIGGSNVRRIIESVPKQ